jgi:energy-coupling factor transporter ATP-binding protein EcfA2
MEKENKISKIESLNDEVNEFHPFLRELFLKLPNVKHVEYTHGNMEYGSDFILVSEDTTLLQENYIGVVVKTSKINIKQNDIDIIQRQIKESFKMPKLTFNGKKKLHLNSVWYVTNKSISHNAKEKIYEYIDHENIKFIDSESLLILVERNFPEFWYNISLNVSTYITKIRTTVEEEDRRYTLLPNLDPCFYIEPEIIKIRSDEYLYKKERRQQKEKADIKKIVEEEKFVILEGGMGYGKSKLLRQLIKYYTESYVYEEKQILVFPFKYSDLFLNGSFDPELLLKKWMLSLEELENHKKSIFMIDGFDEIEEEFHEKIKNIFSLEEFVKKNPKLSILLATRDLREYANPNTNSIVKRYEIKNLSLKQVIRFLEQLCKELNITNRVIEDIKKSVLFKELPCSPIATILLARLFENNSRDLPSNLPQLYSMYIELVLGKWDIDKGLETLKEYEIVMAILYNIASYFIDNQCDSMNLSEYNNIIRNYLESRNLDNESKRIDYIITERSGVLIRDDNKNVVYYSHRSFIEFMYAKGKTINNDLPVIEKVFNLSWQNIYYFYVGLKKDCEFYLEQIMAIEPQSETEKWLRIINLPNFFLAASATPYSFFQTNLHKIFIDAATIFVFDILKNRTSVFANFPKLVALWWIQFIIRESYEFEFFKKALEDATLNIDDASIDEDVKIYALFFIGTLGLRLEIYDPYNFLLSKYKEKLPEDITLGMQNEIVNSKTQQKDLLKSKKWLERRISRMHRHMLKQISYEPIKERKDT